MKIRSEFQVERLKGTAISTNAIEAEFGTRAETELPIDSPPSPPGFGKFRASLPSEIPGRTEIIGKTVEFQLPTGGQAETVPKSKKSGSGGSGSGGSQPRRSLIKPK